MNRTRVDGWWLLIDAEGISPLTAVVVRVAGAVGDRDDDVREVRGVSRRDRVSGVREALAGWNLPTIARRA